MNTLTPTRTVTSRDGTRIAYDKVGTGPAVILISGASAIRQWGAPLAEALAADFTVFNYDRRARGESTDAALEVAIEREFEDLGALIAEAGGSASLYGISSGGALALEAAAAGLPVGKVAVYEVPYGLDADQPRQQQEYVASLERAKGSGKPGAMAEVFFRVMGMGDDAIDQMRELPAWGGVVGAEKSLLYDAAATGTGMPPVERLNKIKVPTLVVTGDPEGEHEVGSKEFFEAAARAIVAAIPSARHETLPGQTHAVDPQVLAPVLIAFYRD